MYSLARRAHLSSSSFFFSVDLFVYRKPSCTVTRKRADDSTSNLTRHIKRCAPKKTPQTQLITAYTSGSSYSKAKFRYLVTMWIVRHHRPFRIVEDEELVELFQMLYAQVHVPTRNSISRDVQEIYTMTKKSIGRMLRVRSRP